MTTRAAGLLIVIGGAALSLGSYLLVRLYVDHAVAADLDVEGGPRVLRLIGAVPALGMAAGLVLTFVGATWALFGDRVRALDMSTVSVAGLAYAVGFAATLVAAIWCGVALFDMDPFGS